MINITINEDLKEFITVLEDYRKPNIKIVTSKYENKDAIYNIFNCMIATYHNETLVQMSFVNNIRDILVNNERNIIEFYKDLYNSTLITVDDGSTLNVDIDEETAEYKITITVNDK